MKLVVDTNILFTFFWKNSFTKGILVDQDLEFLAPELALEEINKNAEEILKKTGISPEKFRGLRRDLAIFVDFIPFGEYQEYLQKADSLLPECTDIDFLAVALKLELPVWSNDSHLKAQSKVKVFTTRELTELLSQKPTLGRKP